MIPDGPIPQACGTPYIVLLKPPPARNRIDGYPQLRALRSLKGAC